MLTHVLWVAGTRDDAGAMLQRPAEEDLRRGLAFRRRDLRERLHGPGLCMLEGPTEGEVGRHGDVVGLAVPAPATKMC